ncbi:MAG: cofactor assembly of complex C subunit B, partial [Synechococcaceae cyanobacterium]|nr:cofactor assembly of complex C subunit B [Synechococcaceae cyanobacterium]
MAKSTASRTLLGAGIAGLALTVLNQVTAPRLEPALERAAVLAGILAVLLMLAGVLGERLQPGAPERAELAGEEGLELAPGLPEGLARELAWGSAMLLTATPAAAVALQWGARTVLRRGRLGPGPFRSGAICRRALERGRPISLVDLRLYPGRAEFDGLLPELPAVLVQPLGTGGVLVLGGWSPRCFSRSDLAWVEGWSRRLTDELAPALGAWAEGTEESG